MPDRRFNLVPSTFTGNVERLYLLQFVPVGLWPRLLCRIILLSDTASSSSSSEPSTAAAPTAVRWNHGPLRERLYWREGIYVKWTEVGTL